MTFSSRAYNSFFIIVLQHTLYMVQTYICTHYWINRSIDKELVSTKSPWFKWLVVWVDYSTSVINDLGLKVWALSILCKIGTFNSDSFLPLVSIAVYDIADISKRHIRTLQVPYHYHSTSHLNSVIFEWQKALSFISLNWVAFTHNGLFQIIEGTKGFILLERFFLIRCGLYFIRIIIWLGRDLRCPVSGANWSGCIFDPNE